MASVIMRKRRILVVDDEANCLKFASAILSHEGFEVKTANTGARGFRIVREWSPDLVLLDITMAGLDGIATLDKIRQLSTYISVIFVSGNSDTDDVVKGLEAGADDYICKPYDPRELIARVKAQLRIRDLYEELKVANKQLTELIDIDDLTGLYNMRSLYDRLEHELRRGFRYGRSVAVVMMDMDYFKTVNDAHDHLFGSYVLSEVGKIIKQNIRSVDLGARYGGDEFLIVLTELNAEGARTFCERLRNAIANHNFENDRDKRRLTASIGYVITDPTRDDLDARNLVRLADTALYEAKGAGRNTICYYDLSHPETQVLIQVNNLRKAQ